MTAPLVLVLIAATNAGCGGGAEPDAPGPLPAVNPGASPMDLEAPLVVRAITRRAKPGVAGRDRLLVLPTGGRPVPLPAATFSGGDAQFPFVLAAGTVVYRCSEGACTLPIDAGTAGAGASAPEPTVIGEAWCLAPSDDPDRVWLAQLDRRRPNRARRVATAEEIEVTTGRRTADLELPPGVGCPVSSFRGGLIFSDRDGLVAVGGGAGGRTPIAGVFPAGARGELVASTGLRPGPRLRLTDLSAGGAPRAGRLDAPAGMLFAGGYNGALSPDGSLLAAAVIGADDRSNHPARTVALVDIARNRSRALGGNADGSFSFSPDGSTLNVVGGPVPAARDRYPSAITSWSLEDLDRHGLPTGRGPFVTETRLELLYMQSG